MKTKVMWCRLNELDEKEVRKLAKEARWTLTMTLSVAIRHLIDNWKKNKKQGIS